MTFLFLRRHAWCVPVALSLWGVASAPATAAEHAAMPVVSDDPAVPDAPVGPPPTSVLSDFVPPALSVATGDWRAVNASVSGMPGMSGMSGGGHDMASHGGQTPNEAAPSSHARHGMPMTPASGGTMSPSPMNHSAMGHAMPMTSPSGAAAATPMDHSAMGHAMPMTSPSGATTTTPMDHSTMGHAMPMTSPSGAAASTPMDHSAMGHAAPKTPVADPHAGHVMQGDSQ